MTYGAEAVIPLETGFLTLRTSLFAPDSNDNLSGSGPNSNDSEGDGNLDGNLEEGSSNQYWIYVDTQLKKFREKAYEIATPEQPAEEVLRW